MSDELEPRLESLIGLLASLAAGDLDARGTRSGSDDELDAVIEGVNMLAEELGASRDELEQRVRDRTAELEQVNRHILALAELGNLLQACETLQESYEVAAQGLRRLFGGLSGAVHLFRASRNILERKAEWGDVPVAGETLLPEDCWALRRGVAHFVDADAPFLSCNHVEERSGDSFCVPMSAHGETVGTLHLMGSPSAPGQLHLSEPVRQLAVAAAEQISLALSNLELRDRLRAQALRDPLTGLHNRRFIDESIEREVARSLRTGESMGVLMLDVDHFKQVNDVHGHDAGDELLQSIAQALVAGLRPSDLSCRYGGEEFLILLTDISDEDLLARAEALRGRVADLRVAHRGITLPQVTVSAGIACFPEHGSTAADVVKAADAALYAAKRAGRDRTCTAEHI